MSEDVTWALGRRFIAVQHTYYMYIIYPDLSWIHICPIAFGFLMGNINLYKFHLNFESKKGYRF